MFGFYSIHVINTLCLILDTNQYLKVAGECGVTFTPHSYWVCFHWPVHTGPYQYHQSRIVATDWTLTGGCWFIPVEKISPGSKEPEEPVWRIFPLRIRACRLLNYYGAFRGGQIFTPLMLFFFSSTSKSQMGAEHTRQMAPAGHDHSEAKPNLKRSEQIQRED